MKEPAVPVLVGLLWFFVLCSFGFLLFGRGFYLTRTALTNSSTILSQSKGNDVDELNGIFNDRNITLLNKTDTCVHMCNRSSHNMFGKRKFQKTIYILLDALRYDFLQFNTSLPVKDELPFQNKFKEVHTLLRQKQGKGKIFEVIADSPTATMQRVKGLTTGTLPTFLDVAKTFNSFGIVEDNIVFQLKANKRRLVFVGADTWGELFPDSLQTALLLPAHNLNDLTGPDNLTKRYVFDTMEKGNFEFLIGHMVGLDHCGHMYGPFHSTTTKILSIMDEFISSLMKAIDNETLLIVIGDHGMTAAGNHGGDSDDEVSAGLLIYTKADWLDLDVNSEKTVHQIDIVPTLSVLLGLPIPFSNLGGIIVDIFGSRKQTNTTPRCTEYCNQLGQQLDLLQVLHQNSMQIVEYLHEYQRVTGDIFYHEGEPLLNFAKEFQKHSLRNEFMMELYNATNETQILGWVNQKVSVRLSFIDLVGKVCRKAWSTFNIWNMIFGALFCILFIICWNYLTFVKLQSGNSIPVILSLRKSDFANLLLLGLYLYASLCLSDIIGNICLYTSLACLVLSRLSVAHIWSILFQRISWTNVLENKANVAITMLFCFYCVSMFSNSFIVYEDRVLVYIVQSLIFITAAKYIWKTSATVKVKRMAPQNFKEVQVSPGILYDIWIALPVSFFCLWSMRYLRECREEQANCHDSMFTLKLSSLLETASDMLHVRLVISMTLCVGLMLGVYYILKRQGNLVGVHHLSLVFKVLLPIALCFVILHWISQTSDNQKLVEVFQLTYLQQVLFPRIIYVLCGISLICLGWNPIALMVIKHPSNKGHVLDTLVHATEEVKVHQLFQYISADITKTINKEQWDNQTKNGEDDMPVVYGLATVYSSAFIVFVMVLLIVFVLVLGDGAAIGIILSILTGYFILRIQKIEDNFSSIFAATVVWSFMASNGFFALGHQAILPSLRMEVGFLGISSTEGIGFLVAGMLIVFNTFASQIVAALTLPLLLLFQKKPFYLEGGEGSDEQKGEIILYENPGRARSLLFKIISTYHSIRFLKLLSIAVAAAWHRRHLMVWKIFSPRFMFEVSSFTVSIPFTFIGVFVFLHTDRALRSWFNQLEHGQTVTNCRKDR